MALLSEAGVWLLKLHVPREKLANLSVSACQLPVGVLSNAHACPYGSRVQVPGIAMNGTATTCLTT